jgi:hypothetical protein
VRGRAYSYGGAGDPNPVEYRCKPFEPAPAPRPDVPDDVERDPATPAPVIEVEPD